MKLISLRIIPIFLFGAVLGLAGCATEETPPESAEMVETESTSLREASADGARSFIVSPADGATVSGPFQVVFGLEGMDVSPAGEAKEFTGHHHLLIDVEEMPNFEMPIPADDNHRHFGAAQTETMLELAPGTHTLQLLLGNYIHVPHNPAVYSEKITITVTE